MNRSLQPGESAPRRNSVVVAILLTFLTLGLYVPIWFIRRRRWLDRLDSPVKIGPGLPWFMLVLHVGRFAVGFWEAELTRRGLRLPPGLDIAVSVAGVVQLLLLFKLAFMIREILGDHLKEVLSKLSGHPSGYSVDLSWIMTLVFSIWYLQYKINECATFSEQWTAMAETPPPA